MSTRATLAAENGFPFVRLTNDHVALAVVPALGARLVSLVDRRTGRDWMWHPPGPLKLWANPPGASFLDGTFAGADECLPTIGACVVRGRELPDHGEVWSLPWQLDEVALARGEIVTTVRLPRSPFVFRRTITLTGHQVRLAYTLTHTGTTPEPWLWALHPLLSYEPGDRLELPAEVANLRVETSTRPDSPRGSVWSWPAPFPDVRLDELQLEDDHAYLKSFIGPLSEGRARLANARTGDALTFLWDVAANPYLGFWLTRGGYNGWHHPALEPTNAPADSLADALTANNPPVLPPGQTCDWWVALHVGC